MKAKVRKHYESIWQEATKAGDDALAKCTPTPMIVQQHSNPLNDNSSVEKEWFVEDGVCGFAWIVVRPGNCSFANFLKEKDYARKDSYYGGVSIWVTVGNQSMQKKETWGRAFAEVLRKYDIDARMMSRMD